MADIARTGDLEVRVVDPVNQYAVRINSDGRLLISSEVSAPANTTVVSDTQQSSINNTTDSTYTITNGKVLTVQKFSAGSQVAQGGSKAELYYDPNGNGTGMTLIAALYVDGSGEQIDLSSTYTGNGTRRILMRRYPFGNTSREIFAKWIGYEV